MSRDFKFLKHPYTDYFMDLELLDMLEEHIQSFRDEAKIKAMMDACKMLIEKDDPASYSFLIGSLYGSCLFIRDSYSSKKQTENDEIAFNEMLYIHVKGLNISKK